MSRWPASAWRQAAIRGASSRAGITTIACSRECGGARSLCASAIQRSWSWFTTGCLLRRRLRRSRSAAVSSAVEAVESVHALACVEGVLLCELACKPVVYLIAPQGLVAADAPPADGEHARTEGELRFDPRDGFLERRSLQVVENLRAYDQIPRAGRRFLWEAGAQQIDVAHTCQLAAGQLQSA